MVLKSCWPMSNLGTKTISKFLDLSPRIHPMPGSVCGGGGGGRGWHQRKDLDTGSVLVEFLGLLRC